MSRRRRPRWSNQSLRIKIFAVIGVPILALVGSTATLGFALHSETAAETAAEKEIEVRQSTEEVRSALEAMSTAQWGSAFGFGTGTNLTAARKTLDLKVKSLRALIQDDAKEIALLQNFESNIEIQGKLSAMYVTQIARTGRIPKISSKVLSDAAALAFDPKIPLQTIADDSDAAIVRLSRVAHNARNRTMTIVILSGTAGAFGGLALMAFAVTGIVRRIRRVGENARRLAAGEDLVSTGADKDEIGMLERELIDAAALLRQREESMRRATTEAERANHAKSEFLSRMSHELRTPLNSILGFGQLMQMDPDSTENKDDVKQILKAGRHLLALIDEVLDIARIEAGEMHCSIEPVWVDEIVREVAGLAKPIADNRRVRILVKQSDVWISADRQRLKQVLLNLVANAIKFNHEGGAVTITATGEADRTSIAITDSGRGIAPDAFDRLFVPFDRLGANNDGIEGTGLGLTLSKRIVDAMKGRINVQSELGSGSTFTIELPSAEPLGEMPFIADNVADTNEHPVVLYIEDNIANLALIERILAGRDLRLISAMKGSLGLELARQHLPSVILLDLHLPDLSGDDVLAQLRSDPRTADIPVVVISADATPASIMVRRDIAAYLTKPLEIPRFLQILDDLILTRSVA